MRCAILWFIMVLTTTMAYKEGKDAFVATFMELGHIMSLELNHLMQRIHTTDATIDLQDLKDMVEFAQHTQDMHHLLETRFGDLSHHTEAVNYPVFVGIGMNRLVIDVGLYRTRHYLAHLDHIRLGIRNRRQRVAQKLRLKALFNPISPILNKSL